MYTTTGTVSPIPMPTTFTTPCIHYVPTQRGEMKSLWCHPQLLERMLCSAASSSMATPRCASVSGIRVWAPRQHSCPGLVMSPRRLGFRLADFSSVVEASTQVGGIKKARLTVNSDQDDTKDMDMKASSAQTEMEMVKEITAPNYDSVGVFVEYATVRRWEFTHVVEQIRTDFIGKKKEADFVVVSPLSLTEDDLTEFERAGATTIVARKSLIDTKLLQQLYKFASTSPPATIVLMARGYMFVNFFNTFIHQYGHRLVFISGRNHDRCLPIRGCQFVIFEKFMNDVHLHLRKAKQGVQPDAEVNDQEVNDQEYGDLKGVEQAKMEPEEVVAHDRIKNIEPEVLPMENADAMSSVRYVEVSGLSRNYSEVKIFKSLEKLTSKLGSEIRAIYTNTGTAKLQFKNKVVAERGIVSINGMYSYGNKLSASLIEDPKVPMEEESNVPGSIPSETKSSQSSPSPDSQQQVTPPDHLQVTPSNSQLQAISSGSQQRATSPDHVSQPKLTQVTDEIKDLGLYINFMNERVLTILKEHPHKMIPKREFSASYSKRYREGMTLRPRGLSLNDLVHACDGVKLLDINNVYYLCLEEVNEEVAKEVTEDSQKDDDTKHPGFFSSMRQTLKKYLL